MIMQQRGAIELPRRMRTLARDERGYPIPFIVLVDRSGQAQFTINDVRRTEQCIGKRLCSICGKRFDGNAMWFVGGSRCFLHPAGAFIDPPLHLDCAEYALRVCPFLAAPSYVKRIDDRKLRPGDTPEGLALRRVDFMPPAQPERFGLGCTRHYRLVRSAHQGAIFTVDRWDYVEWWRNGVTCPAPDTLPLDQPIQHFS